jgi:hypothetical protein
MLNVRKDIKNDKIKNKPNIVAPIINTVISGLAIIGVIVLKCLSSDFSWPLFICFLVVLLLFPVASWYNSYFAKKQKTKMLGSFEKETELIVEFMQHRKHFKAFEENDKISVTVDFEKTDKVNSFAYIVDKSSLGFPDHDFAMISIGIGFAGIEINPETKEVIGVKGLLPRSIWLKKRIKTPTPIKGKLTINTKGVDLRSKTYIQVNKQNDTYYNSKTGWICIGEPKFYSIDDCIEFLEGAYLVLREGKIVSLWLNVGKDLPLY